MSNLRHIIDNAQEVADQQLLFWQFHSHIFYVFYENFLLVEQKLKSATSGKRALDDLNEIVWVLEEIIILLPDLIYQRWQYNSILGVLKRMIHPGNNMETRLQGIELFLLWYQALQDNAGEHVRLIYATLVPGINQTVKSADGRNHTFETLINDNTDGILTPIRIQPLIPPQQNERHYEPKEV